MSSRATATATMPPSRAALQERRRSLRHALGATGDVTLEAEGDEAKRLQVLVLNVSLHGVGFRAPVAFKRGTIYKMRIGSGPLHLTSRLQIMSSRERDDGMYDIGAKFV